MNLKRSPTLRLLAGLAVTLAAVAVYSAYTFEQFRSLRALQTETIDRNRVDSLLLLRIQNNLNSIALGLRDMLDANEPYPLNAWTGQFRRMRLDLQDALTKEQQASGADRNPDQRRYLAVSFQQFWDALDRIFAQAQAGEEAEARTRIRISLQARQEALSTAVARLLVQNNESEQQAATRTREIYARAERNVFVFFAAMLILIALTSLYLVQYNRRMFDRVAALSERRSELAKQLISMQENTFRSISRDLHDDFGQILTAIGTMLQRANRRATDLTPALRADLEEVRDIIQSTLDKVRSLSHALHPVILDEVGLEGALETYLPGFERQTGIGIRYEKEGASRELDKDISIHVYRVMQEALNNVAKHSHSRNAAVRLNFLPAALVLEVEDEGVGFETREKGGMGLISMRERAELVNGQIEFLNQGGHGALVRFTVPLAAEEAHVRA